MNQIQLLVIGTGMFGAAHTVNVLKKSFEVETEIILPEKTAGTLRRDVPSVIHILKANPDKWQEILRQLEQADKKPITKRAVVLVPEAFPELPEQFDRAETPEEACDIINRPITGEADLRDPTTKHNP